MNNPKTLSRVFHSILLSKYTKMLCCLFIVLSVIISVPLALSDTTSNDETIVLVHTIFRHGERTPDAWSTYPKDPYKNATFAPFGRGQLTKKGMQTMLNVGKILRDQYSHFIGDNFSLSSVFAKTTNFKRTKMSLQLVMASLFPPKTEDQLEPNFCWQPMTYTYDSGHNEIADPFYFCLYYLHSYYSYILSHDAQHMISKNTQLFEALANYTGLDIKVPKDVCSLYATLKAQEDFGLELPLWSKLFYPDKLLGQCYLHHHMMSATLKMKRLSTGFLLKKIIDDTNALIQSQPMRKKWYLYSAHDVNLVALVKSLSIYYPHLPPYGATLSLEIIRMENTKDYGFKIVYREKPSSPTKDLTLPNCSQVCPWNKFIELVKSLLPGDYDTCLNTNEI